MRLRRISASLRGAICALLLCGAAILAPSEAWAQISDTTRTVIPRLTSKQGGVLGIMGYGVVPDGSASAVQIDRGVRTDDQSDSGLSLGQLGSGFTFSEGFPIYMEGYIGYARYDPRFVFSGGQNARDLPTRWNSLSATVGVGWDFRLAQNLYFRPIVNAALGHAASDAALFGSFVRYRTGLDTDLFDRGRLNAWGLGGSAVLAYYDHTPAREIDIELRYTNIQLRSFGDTTEAARGSSTAETLGLWARLRWPSGFEAFGRPVRWVLEGTNSYFLGDQRAAVGFGWMAKVGGGIEVDIGRYEIGAYGLYANRVRFLGRYLFGEHGVQGFSTGIGISF